MRLKVHTFKVTNSVYRLRFQNRKVYIECEVPGLQENGKNVVYNRITLGQKGEGNLEYIYN